MPKDPKQPTFTGVTRQHVNHCHLLRFPTVNIAVFAEETELLDPRISSFPRRRGRLQEVLERRLVTRKQLAAALGGT